jgi:hypothetical protein
LLQEQAVLLRAQGMEGFEHPFFQRQHFDRPDPLDRFLQKTADFRVLAAGMNGRFPQTGIEQLPDPERRRSAEQRNDGQQPIDSRQIQEHDGAHQHGKRSRKFAHAVDDNWHADLVQLAASPFPDETIA